MGDGNDLPVEIKKQVLEESVLSLLRDSQYSTKDARNDSPKLAEAFAIFRICFLYVANCTSSSSSTLLGDACAIHWVQQARYKCGLRVISYRIQAAIEWRDDNLDLQFIRLPRGDFLCEPQRCQRLSFLLMDMWSILNPHLSILSRKIDELLLKSVRKLLVLFGGNQFFISDKGLMLLILQVIQENYRHLF